MCIKTSKISILYVNNNKKEAKKSGVSSAEIREVELPCWWWNFEHAEINCLSDFGILNTVNVFDINENYRLLSIIPRMIENMS